MTVKAYIMLNVNTGFEDEVCEELVKSDEVEEVSSVYGEYDALIKVHTKNMDQLDKFILNKREMRI